MYQSFPACFCNELPFERERTALRFRLNRSTRECCHYRRQTFLRPKVAAYWFLSRMRGVENRREHLHSFCAEPRLGARIYDIKSCDLSDVTPAWFHLAPFRFGFGFGSERFRGPWQLINVRLELIYSLGWWRIRSSFGVGARCHEDPATTRMGWIIKWHARHYPEYILRRDKDKGHSLELSYSVAFDMSPHELPFIFSVVFIAFPSIYHFPRRLHMVYIVCKGGPRRSLTYHRRKDDFCQSRLKLSSVTGSCTYSGTESNHIIYCQI